MIWLIIVAVLVLIVAAALLRDNEPAFPSKARRRSAKRGRMNVTRPDDPVPDSTVFAGSWQDDTDCGTPDDSGAADSCSDSSGSSD